jgi:hypothetical protein
MHDAISTSSWLDCGCSVDSDAAALLKVKRWRYHATPKTSFRLVLVLQVPKTVQNG